MKVSILDSGLGRAQEHMDKDKQLLTCLKSSGDLLLHLYDWEQDSASYGHFINPEELLNMEGVKQKGLKLARRVTGGGIIFHISDFAFSLFIPANHPKCSSNTMANYAFVNTIVIEAVEAFMGKTVEAFLLSTESVSDNSLSKNFCMAKPTIYDVMIDGKKVGGAAQRQTKNGVLHHGTIALGMLKASYLQDILLSESGVLEAMQENSYTLLGPEWSYKELQKARRNLKELFIHKLRKY